ncbi:MAG: hypothetical protein ACLFPR_05815 [Desulfococcaceae bacterium]
MRTMKQWLPWKLLIKRAARAYGVIDPLRIMARMRQFSQPSEVQEPIELLRAGIAFHARGLINTKAIQHNLDWVWPYWVERQFNPDSPSFIPRAFSFSHVNLTHRNWTAVGHPDLPLYPIVDPRGLITPHFDGWSLDFWIVAEDGAQLIPSRLETAEQEWRWRPNPAVITRVAENGLSLETRVDVRIREGAPRLHIHAHAAADRPAWLVAAPRPYNPEGIQFIERIETVASGHGLRINGEDPIRMSEAPVRTLFSTYAEGDVVNRLGGNGDGGGANCRVGMATAAAMFPVESGPVGFAVPLGDETDLRAAGNGKPSPLAAIRSSETAWDETLADAARLRIPDDRHQFLYDAALRTLCLLTADDAVPGPYTYRRFWFRDACLMIHALLGVNLTDRSHRILETFPPRQKWNGYFQSQEGEWDSNGQVLWILDRFQRLTGRPPSADWLATLDRGAAWIVKKRLPRKRGDRHGGLFPAGFSAEHLGPNDFYFWDDFWGVAGLRAAGRLLTRFGEAAAGKRYADEAEDFQAAIEASVSAIPDDMRRGGFPAAPYRRMDAGAVGSLVADYPLRLTPPGESRMMATAEFLMAHCFHRGAFFQDMIHSGINAYLTLDIAQTLLRAGDDRWRALVDRVAELASPTGQWPEAVHPITGGGCMGDGQHGWAAAEWLMMMRSLFVREEGDGLVLGAGVAPDWLASGSPLSFGPTPTILGTVSVEFVSDGDALQARLDRSAPPDGRRSGPIVVSVPGFPATRMAGESPSETMTIQKETA